MEDDYDDDDDDDDDDDEEVKKSLICSGNAWLWVILLIGNHEVDGHNW